MRGTEKHETVFIVNGICSSSSRRELVRPKICGVITVLHYCTICPWLVCSEIYDNLYCTVSFLWVTDVYV